MSSSTAPLCWSFFSDWVLQVVAAFAVGGEEAITIICDIVVGKNERKRNLSELIDCVHDFFSKKRIVCSARINFNDIVRRYRFPRRHCLCYVGGGCVLIPWTTNGSSMKMKKTTWTLSCSSASSFSPLPDCCVFSGSFCFYTASERERKSYFIFY